MALEGLPLSLPLSEGAAGAVATNAYRSPDGVTILTNAYVGDGYFEVRLPDPWDELQAWLGESGWTVQRSQAGRYAEALLRRLTTARDLDALASDPAMAVLSALAPPSRLKLAQRIVAEARRETEAELDEAAMAEHLARQSLFLELRARTAADVGGLTKLAKKDVLKALTTLIEFGFVRRGASADCPICGYREVLSLSEQDETIACRACGHRFLLPVTETGGAQERAPVYRLDGLMGRAMDQDLLPVLLAIRALAATGFSASVRAAWPGLELRRGGDRREIDLLISDGDRVWICECKTSAPGLEDEQLDELSALAAEGRARPAIAAPEGDFTDAQRKSVEAVDGRVLTRAELLASLV